MNKKLKILYIIASFPKPENGSNIYTDLAEEMINQGHEVTVVAIEEKKNIENTILKKERNIDVLRVRVGNMYSVGFIEKGISFVTLQFKFKKAIKEYLENKEFDLIVFMAPPVTFANVVKYAKKLFNCKSYLMQKDIFPQNSLDLGLMKKYNPIYWYFKIQEKKLYNVSDIIGCMSQGNIDYLLENNNYLKKEKLEYFPNTMKASTNIEIDKSIREKYNISDDKILAIYGGNFGKPQGIDFILKVLNEYKENDKVIFVFIGKGTEKNKLYSYIDENNITNVLKLEYLPREEYQKLLNSSDIGLIFLDSRFTIPNIPSRTLSYFDLSIPVIAAIDKNTDYHKLIEDSKSGFTCISDNIEDFKQNFDILLNSKEKRKEFGRNGREYFEKNLTPKISVEILEKAYKKMKEM